MQVVLRNAFGFQQIQCFTNHIKITAKVTMRLLINVVLIDILGYPSVKITVFVTGYTRNIALRVVILHAIGFLTVANAVQQGIVKVWNAFNHAVKGGYSGTACNKQKFVFFNELIFFFYHLLF